MTTIESDVQCAELINRLMAGEFSDDETGMVMLAIERYLKNPNVSEIIFYSKEALTAEQVIEQARQYKPIILEPPDASPQ